LAGNMEISATAKVVLTGRIVLNTASRFLKNKNLYIYALK
jgi:hypothetical protein